MSTAYSNLEQRGTLTADRTTIQYSQFRKVTTPFLPFPPKPPKKREKRTLPLGVAINAPPHYLSPTSSLTSPPHSHSSNRGLLTAKNPHTPTPNVGRVACLPPSQPFVFISMERNSASFECRVREYEVSELGDLKWGVEGRKD